MSNNGLSREFLQERDSRIFALRRGGMPVQEIAKRFQMTPAAVNNAVKRQLEKLNRDAALAYPEMLRMELERLDALQASIWQLTQHRTVQVDETSPPIQVEPDLKAVQTVLSIQAQRAKLLGMEASRIDLGVTVDAPQRAVLHGAPDRELEANRYDPEAETREMVALMLATGVLDKTNPALGAFIETTAIEKGSDEGEAEDGDDGDGAEW